MHRASFPTDVQAQPLERLRAPFDSPECLFELKYDGFRGLAYVARGAGELVSRNGNRMRRFSTLAQEIAVTLAGQAAILDGEIVCCGPDGRPRSYDLMFGRVRPLFYAFDLLWLDGIDLRRQPLLSRNRRLKLLLGEQRAGVLRYVDGVAVDGCALFAEVCRRDLEGIVAKWAAASYGLLDGRSSWVKIKNREYSQARDRHELFAGQR